MCGLLHLYGCCCKMKTTGMCSYRYLCLKENTGYISLCHACDNLHIAYGNFLLTLPQHVLPDFQRVLEAYAHNYRHTEVPHIREIYIPMPYMSLALYMSLDEVHELCAMIDAADSELQALQLMRLLTSNGRQH